MLVACLGDVLLDVIVETSGALVTDDDTPARITFTAGGEDPDTGQVRHVGRGRDRGRAREALGEHRPEVAHAGLDDPVLLRDPDQRVVGETDPDRPVDDRDRRRHRPGAPYGGLDLARGAGTGLGGQPVADDRGLQGDDAAT